MSSLYATSQVLTMLHGFARGCVGALSQGALHNVAGVKQSITGTWTDALSFGMKSRRYQVPFRTQIIQQQQHQQRRQMFIQTQNTPNPSSLMFLPGRKVMEVGSKDFTNAREAMQSPLAVKLFNIDGVVGVFFGSDFITVKKMDGFEWPLIKPDIFAAIMDHFSSGKPLMNNESSSAPADTAISPDDSEVVAMIKELLETRIKPAVQEDGGDVLFVSFEEECGRVTLKLQGACAGCPSSSVTLKSGIENMMMHYIPEVKEVVQAEPDEVEEAGLHAFNKLEQHLSS